MNSKLTRRDMLKSSVAMAALAMMHQPLASFGFEDPAAGAILVPFKEKQAGGKMVRWEQLESWLTPSKDLFAVNHYGMPKALPDPYQLELGGLVKKTKTLSLEDIKSRRRKTITATLECSGNGSSPGFMGAVGNMQWTGTPLAPLLKECGIKDRAREVVFFGADERVEEIRKNEYKQNFARSLSLEDALRDDILLAWDMNGEPLTKEHGAPLRLVVPGWFGIAWIKWLTRIELHDRRFMSKYMAREYVTLRGEEKDGKTIWRETSVGPMDIKSIVARVLKLKDGTVRVSGAAWTDGTPLKAVELKLDNGQWVPVKLDKKNSAKYCWTFWNYDWKNVQPGEHTLVSRAIDQDGNIQPPPEDPAIKLKKTYWEANQQVVRKIEI
jgi:DMSO/TMAO reductase YedYZ molybdopterin-dependent catalytic subunit